MAWSRTCKQKTLVTATFLLQFLDQVRGAALGPEVGAHLLASSAPQDAK